MNRVSKTILREIRRHGVIPFARFMQLALYCPHCGYYEQEADNLGRAGDYYTSVSVGSLFGELLAFQFAEWLPGLETRNTDRGTRHLHLVEAGAHDGKLARDILTWLREFRPTLFSLIHYGIVEPSPRRQAWQRRTLTEFGDKVRWFSDLSSLRQAGSAEDTFPGLPLPFPRLAGVIFANELLDAMPVHRLSWDAKAKVWFEWGVALEGRSLVWERLPESPPASCCALHVPPDLLAVLPDGFTTEICPAAADWWREAASVLQHGKLLTLDYGLTAGEFLAPRRCDGTLRAYRRHQLSSDLLANPGAQDLTAHVNFTAIQAAGEAAGLTTESYVTQAQFLVRIAEQTWRDQKRFGEWNANRLRQFKTLTHPEHLGRPFRVLVQSRNG